MVRLPTDAYPMAVNAILEVSEYNLSKEFYGLRLQYEYLAHTKMLNGVAARPLGISGLFSAILWKAS